MKAVVKKQFVGFDREFKPGENVDLPAEAIEKLNAAGLGILLEAEDEAWPKKLTGGHYELSNGEKVKGKDAAHEAQARIYESEEDDKDLVDDSNMDDNTVDSK